ncbi:DnaJ-like protein subfamily C member 2 [Nematocida homosporus]|uniref:DnaJ-like protein subfamily C member 2 n=1 Tax=Nematocida homosporus TaxID=1912981 RepID=UPI0022206606|nr:DnaJ-like protein subfamily C member 2 [Nematocida homosporus]KAI5185741.1 DnaJ-like protein subfamily C member 2 [Nematocida homosporus]
MDIIRFTGQSSLVEIENQPPISKPKLKHPKELFARYTVEQISNWKSIDLYYIMGIDPNEAQTFTESQFKDAYKKQAKLFHPDRLAACGLQDGGASFIALSKAHQTLSSPTRKRQYDHAVFDESLPDDREYTPVEFFRVFGEVFVRNSVLSGKPYTVSLGNLDTIDSDVVSFYKFWQAFESIRSFEFLCESEDCPNRELRRHVANQNKELLQAKKAEDNMRIRKLVNLAIKHDPRVNKKSKQQGPSTPVTVDADGWKSTEMEVLTKIAKTYPKTTRGRVDLIISMFLKKFPSRQKREVLVKLLKLEAPPKKTSK